MPSSHSHSSHSSHSSFHSSSRSSFHSSSHPSSHSSYSHSSHSSFTRSSVRRSAPVYRTRSNQPRGYTGTMASPIHCINHDYIFYAADWESEGTHYKAGYYDENGTYYSGIALKDETTTCKCEYCDTMVKIKWDGGALPACPNCGAPMSLPVDTVDSSANSRGVSNDTCMDPGAALNSVLRIFLILVAIMVGAVILISIVVSIMMDSDDGSYDSGSNYTVEQNLTQAPESFYAAPIGRTCRMDSDGNYYDKETGCYFWFSDLVDPAQWQYWYEDISGDYGDYGWMEYDDNEQQWYIETAEDTWEKLPAGYDTSKLWHFDNAYESGF